MHNIDGGKPVAAEAQYLPVDPDGQITVAAAAGSGYRILSRFVHMGIVA
jgi:hypothetical protein